MDVLVGIKDKLQTAGVGTWKAATGWALMIGSLPTTPETSVSILGTGGLQPNPKYLLDYPSIQIMVRGTESGYEAARAKAQLVKDTLLGLPSQDVGGDRWVLINMIGDINWLGRDEKNRPLFSINFSMIIEPASNAQTNRIAL